MRDYNQELPTQCRNYILDAELYNDYDNYLSELL